MTKSTGKNKICAFSNILVPLDGSDNEYKALRYAVQLAITNNANLTLLHVVEEPRYIIPEGESYAVPKRIVDYGENVLSIGKDLVGKSNVKTKLQLLKGNPAERIFQYSNKGNFDLIVMGTRGLSRMKSMVFGSVSDKLVHFSKCHIMLIRPDTRIEPGRRYLF